MCPTPLGKYGSMGLEGEGCYSEQWAISGQRLLGVLNWALEILDPESLPRVSMSRGEAMPLLPSLHTQQAVLQKLRVLICKMGIIPSS